MTMSLARRLLVALTAIVLLAAGVTGMAAAHVDHAPSRPRCELPSLDAGYALISPLYCVNSAREVSDADLRAGVYTRVQCELGMLNPCITVWLHAANKAVCVVTNDPATAAWFIERNGYRQVTVASCTSHVWLVIDLYP